MDFNENAEKKKKRGRYVRYVCVLTQKFYTYTHGGGGGGGGSRMVRLACRLQIAPRFGGNVFFDAPFVSLFGNSGMSQREREAEKEKNTKCCARARAHAVRIIRASRRRRRGKDTGARERKIE